MIVKTDTPKIYLVPRFHSVWENFISCLFRKSCSSSEAFSTTLYDSMLTAAVSRKFWRIVRICIPLLLYISLQTSLHYVNSRFLNFTFHGRREPQDRNDFHCSFTETEYTPLESNCIKMSQHLRNWATRNNSSEVCKKSMSTVLSERFAPCSRFTPECAFLVLHALRFKRRKPVNLHPCKNNELWNCCPVSFLQRKHSVLIVLRFLSSRQPLL